MVKDEWPKHKTRMHSRERLVVIPVTSVTFITIAAFIFPPKRVPASFPLLKKSVVSQVGARPCTGWPALFDHKQTRAGRPFPIIG
jgi:hypothetical protein